MYKFKKVNEQLFHTWRDIWLIFQEKNLWSKIGLEYLPNGMNINVKGEKSAHYFFRCLHILISFGHKVRKGLTLFFDNFGKLASKFRDVCIPCIAKTFILFKIDKLYVLNVFLLQFSCMLIS